ncbi:2-keto-4-pentenoate hydratase [Pseudonocardia hydrocarbonoxydans]|uniref:Putative hydratase/decarboxylase n=1 Tax=Pseudonocardia hydrocarbonoxydans TaxID=76726 RepID=A0A4Y3WVJ3_9PSEU|nr:fumarylacetoacetate hydrolase family protein [Pseudonocardia hydrocarbonoxydans]GEC22912.1 putative hydratase/decarboxylase [Pseudonocardia hydrocarbonoxydans]
MTDAAHEAAATCLRDAARTGRPCPPVRGLLPDRTMATGYAVQSLLTAARLGEGRRVVGRKIGLTAPKVQAQLGVDQPDFGVLFDDMACPHGEVVDIDRLLQPKIEAEIAFVLAADLDREDLTEETVRSAVGQAVAALEIVDSRIDGWDITLVDTVADNASSGLYVLGDEPVELGSRDLRGVEMVMVDDTGAEVSSGSGADCMGDPIAALLWLARVARDVGSPLRAGDVVLSGALGPMVPVTAGATYRAELTALGTVSATFSHRD